MANTRLCPVCGESKLVADCRSIKATIKGQQITVPNVCADFCPACGEGILYREDGDRYAPLASARQGGKTPGVANIQ